ncbi:uncharacterized protein LOC129588781 [Paramacrobiotus metropolitanus]|uniref:uncharacterized protein LOC129588781 n=1 Tax=Paramacrobiotus metropolitanus TaxID=2943436 RepID=UPI0024456261|nr:uncharacterized protein LOC129588781 [Paramacrobiotus metropolitanus]
MHATTFCVMLIIFTTECYSLELCGELEARCQTLREKFREADWAFYVERWNITDEEANRAAPAEQEFCRLGQETGQCLKSMNEHCPEHSLPRDASGWFMVAWHAVNAKLCGSPFGPRRYVPALRACYDRNEEIPDRSPFPANSSFLLQSHDTSSAKRNVCSEISRLMAHVNGTARAAVIRQCGEEGMRILIEGTGFLFTVGCIN